MASNPLEYTIALQCLQQVWDHGKIVLDKGSSSHPEWITVNVLKFRTL